MYVIVHQLRKGLSKFLLYTKQELEDNDPGIERLKNYMKKSISLFEKKNSLSISVNLQIIVLKIQ